jgi:hypothetical protein
MPASSQPQFRDKRLPDNSEVWTDINDLRWHFLFGGLFVPDRPIDPEDQPSMGGEDDPDLNPTPDTTLESGSQNIDEAGEAAGQGNYNPDVDGENPEDGDADTDSKPDHEQGEGDESGEDDDQDEDGGGDDEEDEDEGDGNDYDPNDFGYERPANSKPELPGYDFDTDTNTTTRTFESWIEFVQCASDMSLRGWHYGAVADRREHKGGDYAATETLDQAVDMAMWSGWPEGRKMLIDSIAQVRPTNQYRVHHELDVAGSFPIVPVYCAGDPAHMMNFETETVHQQRPIVRIDYNNVCSFLITPAAMMKMGAAVLSFAQTLEAAGYAVELRVIGNMASGKKKFRYSVTYKRAGEPFDLDRAAFAIAHPSTMRRFALGLLEQHADLQNFGENGHGYPLRQPNDPTSGQPGGAIYIPPAYRNYSSIAECKTIVENAAADLISKLSANLAA